MSGQVHLLVFVKYPEAGRVKTRLAQSIGSDPAARLYREWVEICVQRYRSLPNTQLTLFFDPIDKEEMFRQWLGNTIGYLPQPQGDLGHKLSYGFASLLKENRRAIALGTDSPDLPLDYLRQAADDLQQHDVVIGPAEDGGYYLIGLSRWLPELFVNIPWSTKVVFEETMKRIQEHKLRCQILPTWYDIDTLADWERYRKRMNQL